MDPASHFLVAAIAAEALGPGPAEPWALAAATGAAILPDLDFLVHKLGDIAPLTFHGTVTHSFVGASILAVAWGGALGLLSGAGTPLLVGYALCGALTHLLLDVAGHQRGVSLLWPFTPRRIRSSLLVGLNTSASTRCGEHKLTVCALCQARFAASSPIFRFSAAIALAGLAAWPYRRDVAVAGAIGLVVFAILQVAFKARAARIAGAAFGRGTSVYPASYSGLRWLAAAPCDGGVATSNVDVLRGRAEPPRIHRRASEPLRSQVAHRDSVAAVTAMSVEPFAELSPDGREVWWRDLSFDHDPEVPLHVLKIGFDENGEVAREEFRERW